MKLLLNKNWRTAFESLRVEDKPNAPKVDVSIEIQYTEDIEADELDLGPDERRRKRRDTMSLKG